MKIFFPIFIAATITIKTIAADTNAPALPKTADSALQKIGTAEAANYYDKTVIVTGKVAQVTIRPKVVFLNLDKSYPDSPFTVVIFRGHSSFYGDANALRGKSIEIKGKVVNYHDKPEIALDNTNQLTVLGVTNLSLLLAPKVATLKTNAPAILPMTNPPPVMQTTNLPEIM